MRIEQITFTRFIAAIAIVIFHFGTNIFPFNNHYIGFLFKNANVGVSYFFVLSGFVMIMAYYKNSEIDSFEYYKNRFARIYPVYFLAILLLYLYQIIKGSVDYSGLFLNLLVIQAWIPGNALSFNSPGWSLSVELLFYAIFPVIFNKLYKKMEVKKFTIPIILFFIISQVLFQIMVHSGFNHGFPSKSHDLIYYFPLMHLNEFLVGNLAGLYFKKEINRIPKNYDLQIIIILILIILTLKYPFGLNFHDGLLAILFIPLLILMSLNNGLLTSIFKNKILVFLGEISFGIYILQIPVIFYSFFLCKKLSIKNEQIVFYISLIALITVSALSYTFIEAPLREKIKKLKRKKQVFGELRSPL